MSIKTLLNKTCILRERSYTQSSDTGQQQDSYTTLFNDLPCRLRTRTVSERKYSSPEYSHATHSIYIEAKTGIKNKKLIIQIGTVSYDVLGLIDMGGEDKLYCLYAERRS